MTTSFPTGLDALTNPTGSSSLTSPDHAGQHADINDAVEALEAKVGINGSAVTTSLDYKVAKNILANPVGMISPYAGSTAPTDWQLCYGQAISRTTYSSLFAVISTTYGVGDGSTTFNIPDLRGRTIAGLDNMGGTDAGRLSTANTLGTTTGTETVTLTSAESGVPAHSHANTAAFTGTAASHTHTQDAHNHGITDPGHFHNQETIYLRFFQGAFDQTMYVGGYNSGYPATPVTISKTTGITINNATATNQNTSITPAGTVAMTNANNTAANAASAHNNMQPTMTINYIIFAGA